jgi:putative endonuclease
MQEKAYYIYILKCRDDTLYTGTTNEVGSRVSAHNDGRGAKYTKGRLPVTLVYSETLDSKSAALKREIAIKKLSRKKKIGLIERKVLTSNP